MYYVTSKQANELGKRTLLGSVEKRETAREMARTQNGTVRTQAEYDDLVAAGEIETVEHVTEGPVESMGEMMDADEARVEAETQKQVEEEQAKHAEPEAEESPIIAAARKVAAAPKVKRTVGAKEKAEPKRKATDPEVIKAAERHLRTFVQQDPAPTKVQIVREMAGWNGNALQRKDVFAVIKGCLVDLEIASATVSTQFQLVRSGKAPKAKAPKAE